MAAFSSRGPNGAAASILKPDVTAPGVNILAGHTPEPLFGVAGQLYQTASGTSMSSPHVAGVGALIKQMHPTWSPAMIKSALMTSAQQTAFKEDGSTPADPFDMGAGHIAPNGAGDPGLVYDADFIDYLAFLCGSSSAVVASTCSLLASWGLSFDASDMNLASIAVSQMAGSKTVLRRVTNMGAKATYFASVSAPAGIQVTVNPTSLTLDPGQTEFFMVTFTAQAGVALDTWAFGSLTWSDGTHNVRSPIAVRPVFFGAPKEVIGSGTAGSVNYTVGFGYTGAFSAAGRGLVAATKTAGNVVDDPANDINVALDSGVGITIHKITVPADTAHARFSLFDDYTDGDDDLDLYVFAPNGAYVGGSGSGTSAEQVDVTNPVEGDYYVIVHGWQSDGADANYTLFSWTVPSVGGSLGVTAPTAAVLGAQGQISATWSGLATATKYMGLVQYTGTVGIGATLVRVDTN